MKDFESMKDMVKLFNELTKKKKQMVALSVGVAIIIISIIAGLIISKSKGKKEDNVVSTATLEKIINVDKLSTLKQTYNGVTTVKSEDKVDYYVAYKGEIQAGFDFSKLDITISEEDKKITVKLPQMKITKNYVDMNSLEFIFRNDKANTSGVLEEAYKKCIADLEKECNKDKNILDLAVNNSTNAIKGLLEPFVRKYDEKYEILVIYEGE